MSDNTSDKHVESSLNDQPTKQWSESTQKIVGVFTVVFLGLACFTSGYFAAQIRN